MNPELRRLLWLEATPARLVLLPTVLFLLLAAATLADGGSGGAHTAFWAAVAVGVLWGTRLAAQALLAEIAANTWDGQRASVLSAWQMTVGKLAGATAIAWYGLVLCAIGATLLDPAVTPPEEWRELALIALLAQAGALFVALLMAASDRRGRMIDGFAAQVTGIGAGIALHGAVTLVFQESATFWGAPVAPWMAPVALVLFAALAIGLAWWRMGEVLQTYAGAWVWPAFLLAIVLVAGGHGYGTMPWSAAAFTWLLPIGWLALLLDPKQPVGLHAWLRRPAWRDTPSWLVAFGLLVILAGLSATGRFDPGLPAALDIRPDWMDWWDWRVATLPALAFFLRDAALMHLIAWGGLPGRGLAAVLIHVAVLYGVLPVIVATTLGEGWLWLLLPVPGTPMLPALAAPLAQAAVLGALAWRRLALLIPENRR